MDKESSQKKIVFFGTPEFAVASLDALLKSGIEVAAVVTATDKPAGRGHKLLQSDVKKYALAHDLPVLQPEKLRDPVFIEKLREINADLFVIIAFRMLPEIVWSMPPLGSINLHASLLPKYRGAAPINHAVINGDSKTGVTTFFLKHEIDTGDMIRQEEIDILPDENAGDIHDKLMMLGAKVIVETVKNIFDGRITTTPQPDGDFSPAPKIFKDTCRINWSRPVETIHNLIRGLSPYPAAWSTFMDSRTGAKTTDVKIFKSALTDERGLEEDVPGDVTLLKDRLFVNGPDGRIEILNLQPAGRKPMSAAEFLRGYNPVKFQ